jgi:hypothetical protein
MQPNPGGVELGLELGLGELRRLRPHHAIRKELELAGSWIFMN